MTIIAMWQINSDDQSDPITAEQLASDYAELEKLHQDMVENHPTWGLFGGIIEIENRRYQVT